MHVPFATGFMQKKSCSKLKWIFFMLMDDSSDLDALGHVFDLPRVFPCLNASI
jgi:hypothetical protein